MFINLSTIERVKNFVHEISSVQADVELMDGRNIVDPKSIMGIFALNLCENIELRVRRGDIEGAMAVAKKYN